MIGRFARLAVFLFLVLSSLVPLARAQQIKPTIYYYEARGQALLAVEPAGEGRPAFLVFPDHCRFSADFAVQVGETLFPGDANARAEQIRLFQEALKTGYSSAVQVSGVFDLNTVEQIFRSSEKLAAESDLGPVHMVQLNKLLQSATGVPAVRAFLSISTQMNSGAALTDDQINRCRATMERNLTLYVERSEIKLAQGAVRGVFGLAVCSGDRTDTDGDGLYDLDEINLYGSDPTRVDTDGDGISDSEEVAAHSRGLMLDPTKMDTDGDGLNDKQEMDLRARGILVDPSRADTDGDGLTDKQEIESKFHGRPFDPTNPHSFPGDMDDKEVYERYILNSRSWGWEETLVIVAAAAMLGAAFFVVRMRRNNGRVAHVSNGRLRRSFVRRTVVPAPLVVTKAEAGIEASAARAAVMDPIERRIEPTADISGAGRPHGGAVEQLPLRSVRSAPEFDDLTPIRGQLDRFERTFDELERRTANERGDARRALDEITARLDAFAASLATLERRQARQNDAAGKVELEQIQSRVAQLASDLRRMENERPVVNLMSAPAAEADPRVDALNQSIQQLARRLSERDGEQIRRLDELDAAVRTLEHVFFAEEKRGEKTHERIAAVENAVTSLSAASRPKFDASPLPDQIRDLNIAINEWKTNMSALLADLSTEQNGLKGRLSHLDERLAARTSSEPEQKPALPSQADLPRESADLGALKERLDAIGRVIVQINQRFDQQPAAKLPFDLLRRFEALEKKVAGAATVSTANIAASPEDEPATEALRKAKDVEQMVVRSMSEWGRLFTDLEEKIRRLEHANKLKK